MNNEIQKIIQGMEEVFSGDPWYGKSISTLFEEIDPSKVYTHPNGTSHSLIELIYHMITWQEFTFRQIEAGENLDVKRFEEIDWRRIDPNIHQWKTAVEEFKHLHLKIISLLKSSADDLLDKPVVSRPYDFRYLLNGIIQHYVYHAGQLAYVNKLLT